jgi:rod shape-determining protein MreC
VHDKAIRRRRAVLALLVVISLILLTAYFGESPSSPLHSVQRGVVAVLAPIQDGASKVLSPVRDVAGWISSTVDAKSQNSELKKENSLLQAQVDQSEYDLAQFRQDQRLLHLDASDSISSYSPVTANVIGKDPVLWYDTIEVDAGSSEGVRLYDPVIGDGGLVGDVTTVLPSASIVTLVTSPSFAVGAMVVEPNQTSYSGVLKPKVGNPEQLLLSYLPANAQISQSTNGQPPNVVTSGFKDPSDSSIQSLYPPGIPIGTVSESNASIQDSLINSQTVDVTPVVDLQHLTVVQILTHPHPTTESASLP